MTHVSTIKLSGELTDASTTARRAGHLKWGDIVLKRGVAEVPAWSLLTLRAGQTFAMEVPYAVFEVASDLGEPLDDVETEGREVYGHVTEW